MRKITLCQRTLELTEQQVAKHNAKRTTGVWLRIDASSYVETGSLAFYFDLVCRGSVAESCKLYLEEQEAECWYETCQQYAILLTQRARRYPQCCGDMLQIATDDGLQIWRTEIDQEQVMCTTCGCDESNLYIGGDEHNLYSAFCSTPFAPAARPKMKVTGIKALGSTPSQTEKDDLRYGHGEAGVHAPGMSRRRISEVETDVLNKNNRLAERSRACFATRKQLVLNLVSSPDSDKTTLLTKTLIHLKNNVLCAIIEDNQ